MILKRNVVDFTLAHRNYTLNQRGVALYLSGLNKQPENIIRSVQLIPKVIPEENVLKTFQETIHKLEACLA